MTTTSNSNSDTRRGSNGNPSSSASSLPQIQTSTKAPFVGPLGHSIGRTFDDIAKAHQQSQRRTSQTDTGNSQYSLKERPKIVSVIQRFLESESDALRLNYNANDGQGQLLNSDAINDTTNNEISILNDDDFLFKCNAENVELWMSLRNAAQEHAQRAANLIIETKDGKNGVTNSSATGSNTSSQGPSNTQPCLRKPQNATGSSGSLPTLLNDSSSKDKAVANHNSNSNLPGSKSGKSLPNNNTISQNSTPQNQVTNILSSDHLSQQKLDTIIADILLAIETKQKKQNERLQELELLLDGAKQEIQMMQNQSRSQSSKSQLKSDANFEQERAAWKSEKEQLKLHHQDEVRRLFAEFCGRFSESLEVIRQDCDQRLKDLESRHKREIDRITILTRENIRQEVIDDVRNDIRAELSITLKKEVEKQYQKDRDLEIAALKAEMQRRVTEGVQKIKDETEERRKKIDGHNQAVKDENERIRKENERIINSTNDSSESSDGKLPASMELQLQLQVAARVEVVVETYKGKIEELEDTIKKYDSIVKNQEKSIHMYCGMIEDLNIVKRKEKVVELVQNAEKKDLERENSMLKKRLSLESGSGLGSGSGPSGSKDSNSTKVLNNNDTSSSKILSGSLSSDKKEFLVDDNTNGKYNNHVEKKNITVSGTADTSKSFLVLSGKEDAQSLLKELNTNLMKKPP